MDECNREVLCFQYDKPNDFHKIVGQKSERHSRVLLVFRVLEVLYSYAMLIWIVCTRIITPHRKIFASYCTWTQFLFSTSVEAEFGVVAEFLKNLRRNPDANETPKLPWYCKVYWALFSAALPALVVSCVTYWTEMYEGKPEMIYVFMSTVTLLVILCEFFMIAFPMRLLYFYYFIIFILLYIIFSVIYQSIANPEINSKGIYKDLNWHKPRHALLTCFIATLIGQASYFTFWVINRMITTGLFCRRDV